ncbi:MAG: hypothetical protein ACI4QE_00835 [Acutalibacteraceae bacterium]
MNVKTFTSVNKTVVFYGEDTLGGVFNVKIAPLSPKIPLFEFGSGVPFDYRDETDISVITLYTYDICEDYFENSGGIFGISYGEVSEEYSNCEVVSENFEVKKGMAVKKYILYGRRI